jgi:hypothetical protein
MMSDNQHCTPVTEKGLTVNSFNSTLPGLYPPSIADEGYDIIYHPLHPFFRHDVA